MSYLVLARKWRPRLFEEVIGQRHVTKTLQNAITSNRVAHAFLFTGTRGVGKTSVARILAKALNCHEGPTPKPCNQCQSCTEIDIGVSMDILEIDGASNTGVDDVRELRENVRYLPSKGKHKVYIIDEVHMLSNSAFNALLKTLEEPPEHIIFIFATTEPHKIPATILSRCQRYDFKRIPARDILAQLKLVVSDEKVSISDESLALIARKAEGSMRDAQSILDQAISYAGRDVNDDEVVEILGIVDHKLLFETSLSIIEREPRRCLDVLEDVYNFGCDIKEFYKDLLEHFRNLVVVKVAENPSRLIDLPESEIEELNRQGASVDIDEIQQLFKILSASEDEIIRSTNPKLIMEMTLVRMAHTRPLLSIDSILDRMKSLEKKLIQLGSNGNDSDSVAAKRPQSLDPPSERPTGHEDDNAVVSGDNKTGDGESRVEELDAKETWSNLIDFIKKKRPLLASILELGQLRQINDEMIDIGFEGGSVFLNSVNERHNKEELIDFCKEFFKKEIAVCISATAPSPDSASIKKKENKIGNEAKKREYEALNNPVIQDAISILGGEITEIRTGQI